MTLNMGASLNFINFHLFQLNCIIVMSYSKNNVLSHLVITLQAAHMYLEDGVFHNIPCMSMECFQAHITFTMDSLNCSTSYCQDKTVEIFRYK